MAGPRPSNPGLKVQHLGPGAAWSSYSKTEGVTPFTPMKVLFGKSFREVSTCPDPLIEGPVLRSI